MLKRYKQFFLGFIIASIVFSAIGIFADNEITAKLSDIKVTFNNKLLNLKDANGNKVQPLTYNGTTYLPVRALAETFDKEVDYDVAKKIVKINDKVKELPVEEVIEPLIIPKSKAYPKEEIKEIKFETTLINGKEYITYGQFDNVYYHQGYVLQNRGNGYFRFYYKENNKQTDLIKNIKVLIQDNEYYFDYEFYKTKMLPLIK